MLMVKEGLAQANSSMKMAASMPLEAVPPNGTGIRPLRKPAATARSRTGLASSARVSGSGSTLTAAARS